MLGVVPQYRCLCNMCNPVRCCIWCCPTTQLQGSTNLARLTRVEHCVVRAVHEVCWMVSTQHCHACWSWRLPAWCLDAVAGRLVFATCGMPLASKRGSAVVSVKPALPSSAASPDM